jgi:hypothetical protein
MDPNAPDGLEASIVPPWTDREPWADSEPFVETGPAAAPHRATGVDPAGGSPAGSGQPGAGEEDGWFVESFTALLHLDAAPIEALEQRTIVATQEGLRELVTSVSIPRHPEDDAEREHGLESELLEGGSLELREQPYESYFCNVIVLPRPLHRGERHDYALRLRIPPGQPMASHYVYVPFRRSDYFELRVCFDPQQLPRAVWALSGAPTAVIYERCPTQDVLVPDRFGEVRVRFRNLKLGFGYGVCWQE